MTAPVRETRPLLEIDGPVRWVASRKEELVVEIRRGRIARAEAIARFRLTDEELTGWERRFRAHGRHGLKATKLQESRA